MQVTRPFSQRFCSSLPEALADGLDGTLEAGGCLQLQLVGHGVDLEAVQPGGTKRCC